MPNDDFEKLPPEAFKYIKMGSIIAFIVLGIIGGISGTGAWRVDRFDTKDADRMKFEMREYVNDTMVRHHLEIPPEPTRRRIRAIEHCLEQKPHCTDFKVPTHEWYPPLPPHYYGRQH